MERAGRSALLVVAMVVALTGCKSTAQTITPTANSTLTPMQKAEIFYVGDTSSGFKLFSENYPVTGSGLTSLTKLISDLLDGKAVPLDPDYSNLWGHGTSLLSIKVNVPSVTINLNLGKLNLGAEAEIRAIDEIFWTIAKFMPKITRMNLLVDGKRIGSLAGHVDSSKAFLLEPAYKVLSPVQITSIYEGEKLVAPIIIIGQACTFEAGVAWKLSKDEVIIKSGAVTAQEACPTRSRWTLNLGQLAPGNYQLSVQDISPKDGSIVAQDTKKFVINKL